MQDSKTQAKSSQRSRAARLAPFRFAVWFRSAPGDSRRVNQGFAPITEISAGATHATIPLERKIRPRSAFGAAHWHSDTFCGFSAFSAPLSAFFGVCGEVKGLCRNGKHVLSSRSRFRTDVLIFQTSWGYVVCGWGYVVPGNVPWEMRTDVLYGHPKAGYVVRGWGYVALEHPICRMDETDSRARPCARARREKSREF